MFGYIPVLPCIKGNKPPVLNAQQYKELLRDHLELMRKSRLIFAQRESSLKVRRELANGLGFGPINSRFISGDPVTIKERNNDAGTSHPFGYVVGQNYQYVLVKTKQSWFKTTPCQLTSVTYAPNIEKSLDESNVGLKNILIENFHLKQDTTYNEFSETDTRIKTKLT